MNKCKLHVFCRFIHRLGDPHNMALISESKDSYVVSKWHLAWPKIVQIVLSVCFYSEQKYDFSVSYHTCLSR